jgi:hypothetical protein
LREVDRLFSPRGFFNAPTYDRGSGMVLCGGKEIPPAVQKQQDCDASTTWALERDGGGSWRPSSLKGTLGQNRIAGGRGELEHFDFFSVSVSFEQRGLGKRDSDEALKEARRNRKE